MIFFAKKIKNNTLSFFDDDKHHLIKTLRVQINDKLICAFNDNLYKTKIISLEPLLAEIQSVIVQDNNIDSVKISLFQSIIKPKYFEWILLKATEMQIDNIYPVIMQRVQSQFIPRQERMQSIIKAAVKQSNQIKLPNIFPVDKLENLMHIINNHDLVIVPYENEETIILGALLNQTNFANIDKIGIIIGCEGGFSTQEIELLKQSNKIRFVKLTNSILRSETATLYTLSVVIDYLTIRKKK